MKVVYIGFLKTGSRSICDYCKNLLNYDVYQGTKADLHSSFTDIIFPDVFTLNENDLHNCFHKGHVDNSDVYDYLNNNINLIAKEFPYFGMYQYIHENFPDSKFIICIRDPAKTFESYKNFMNGYRNPNKTIKINKALFGIDELINDTHKNKFIEVYNNHNNKILEFFKDKKEKLLILDFDEFSNFEPKISHFLGVENKSLKLENLKGHNF